MHRLLFSILLLGMASYATAQVAQHVRNGNSESKIAMAEHAPNDPVAFLKWSVEQYHALQTFQADSSLCGRSLDYPAQYQAPSVHETIFYQNPNRFKVVSKDVGSYTFTSVCDGRELVDYIQMNFESGPKMQGEPKTYPAPASIADTMSSLMDHLVTHSPLLYKFFGDSEKLLAGMDRYEMPLHFGADVTLDGQLCKTLLFTTRNSSFFTVRYPSNGLIEVAIGTKDGLIRRIHMAYVFVPYFLPSTPPIACVKRREEIVSFSHIRINLPLPASTFDVSLSKEKP